VSLYEQFLPHPHLYKHGHHRRAKLLHLPALASYLFFLLSLIFSISFTSIHLPGILGYATNINFDDLVKETNKRRVEQGLQPLAINSRLNAAAASKGAYMFTHNFWAHVAPDGTTPWYFFTNAGYEYRFAGENLARDFNDSNSVVEAWMDSPSHRENLLNPNYTDIGFAVVNGTLGGQETTLVVQLFGKPLSPNYLATVPSEAATAENARSVSQPAGEKLTVTPINNPPALENPAASSPAGQILPAVNIFNASKGVTLALGLFMTLLLAIDGVYAIRHRILRLSGSTLAHLGLLALAMIGIWYTNVGAIV